MRWAGGASDEIDLFESTDNSLDSPGRTSPGRPTAVASADPGPDEFDAQPPGRGADVLDRCGAGREHLADGFHREQDRALDSGRRLHGFLRSDGQRRSKI